MSTETVRRDLAELTKEGLISRTYGGAVRRSSLEPGLNERHALLVEERQAIARAAVADLAGARHLMIGSGATTVHVARRLAFEMNNLTVITHSFGVATVLSLNPTIRVMVTPVSTMPRKAPFTARRPCVSWRITAPTGPSWAPAGWMRKAPVTR